MKSFESPSFSAPKSQHKSTVCWAIGLSFTNAGWSTVLSHSRSRQGLHFCGRKACSIRSAFNISPPDLAPVSAQKSGREDGNEKWLHLPGQSWENRTCQMHLWVVIVATPLELGEQVLEFEDFWGNRNWQEKAGKGKAKGFVTSPAIGPYCSRFRYHLHILFSGGWGTHRLGGGTPPESGPRLLQKGFAPTLCWITHRSSLAPDPHLVFLSKVHTRLFTTSEYSYTMCKSIYNGPSRS